MHSIKENRSNLIWNNNDDDDEFVPYDYDEDEQNLIELMKERNKSHAKIWSKARTNQITFKYFQYLLEIQELFGKIGIAFQEIEYSSINTLYFSRRYIFKTFKELAVVNMYQDVTYVQIIYRENKEF